MTQQIQESVDEYDGNETEAPTLDEIITRYARPNHAVTKLDTNSPQSER